MAELDDEVTVPETEEKLLAAPLSYPYVGGGAGSPRLQGIAKFKVVDGKLNDVSASPQITLPLPADLAFADGADYENAELGSIGAQFADGNVGGAMGSLFDTIKNGGGGDVARSVLAKFTGNRTRAKLKTTPNPNTRAMFKQVNIRTFEFSYKFIPTSAKEANEVKRIVKAFRSELYPTDASGDDNDGFKISYNFPNRYQIKFFLGDEEEGRFEIEPKLLPCYLTSVSVKYNTANVLREGSGSTTGQLAFAETSLSMSFREDKTLLSTNIRKEGY